MSEATECVGKQAWESWDLAHEVCIRMRARKAGKKRDLHVYRCRECALWHIGANWRKPREMPLKRRGR